MPFSERMGYREQRPIQIESMDRPLRNGLFNVARNSLIVGLSSIDLRKSEAATRRFNDTWATFFKRPLHESPANFAGAENSCSTILYDYFGGVDWYLVYDLVEFLVNQSDGRLAPAFSVVLEREVAGYRILENMVVPISDADQIDAIRTALESSATGPLRGAHEHLATALRLLSDRSDPDYRNSVKESISAIESTASVLGDVTKPQMKDALRILERRGQLHPALRGAFQKLYGWTSDEDGVRHALMDDSSLDFPEAQFMLVACSAFVHYLVARAAA